MRDIKFRAWAAKYKQMYWFDIMWGNKHASGSGWIGMLPISETERDYGLYRDNRVDVDPHDCELMQYTGLKDKNGKEIYEGDIIKDSDLVYEIRFGSYLIEPCEYTGFYMWRNDEAGMIGECDQQVIRVVGNIYENPDLLSSEQNVKASVATESDSSKTDD